ncbi:hypothetical protein GLAREA_07741 [Glarea lozoyensis ATCC 20868]|uniref:CHRD domain-containing protein n=2 Tax=Glarea lozoyensis TaxID=101852 RepID=S3D234_GLAL2|nr:uncharacterized protein GLAREA_07741 [Glarea lozoyensis ATCC 20868]EHK98632.1 hypothetical protein M7I_5515 [Glarea lozoyensis 74030]EPE32607.1 hypothetical protein GLAREA_07741 [Glarea lozoyensis ATCC 20868]
MKFTQLTSLATVLALSTATPIDYTPKGGWESVTYPAPPGGWESIKYPPGTGENLKFYPAPPGGWESVNYGNNYGQGKWTSTYHVKAIGAEVRNGTTPAPGPADAVGYFDFQINSKEDKICYQITLYNVAGVPQSPAKTATHIHEAVRGASGPPRLAFNNPVGDDKMRYSEGCLTGPFTTGLNGADGKDTATGFKVAQIEANPKGFFTDHHTSLFTLGVVRGQLA